MTNIETTHLIENAAVFNEAANNTVDKSKPPNQESLCFVDLAEKWLLSEKIKTKESTFVQYNLILKNHIYPLLGKYLVVDIDRQTIEQTVIYYLSNGRLDGGGGLATKTTSDILMVIKSIFDYANQTGILSSLPTKGVCVKKRTKELCVLRESMYYGQNVLNKFPERIIFSLGSNDADNLIENVSVAGLRENTVYFTDGVKNTFQLKPYITPSIEELEQMIN